VTAYNSVITIRQDARGAPLGIRIPLRTFTGIVIGWGSAIAAPWPMPALALLASGRARRDGDQRAALACAGIGLAGIVGIFIEPNTYKPTSWTPQIRRAIVAHVVSSTTLVATALSHQRPAPASRA
jgi:hypothetical protein